MKEVKEGKIIQFPKRRLEGSDVGEIPIEKIFRLSGEVTLSKVEQMEAVLEGMVWEGEKELHVEVMSEGGKVEAVTFTHTLFERLREQYGATITTIGLNHVRSAGFDIWAFGDQRLAYPHTTFYLHNTQARYEGDLDNIREDVKSDTLEQRFIDREVAKSFGITRKDLKEMKNKYFTEHQMLEKGLLHGVIIFQR